MWRAIYQAMKAKGTILTASQFAAFLLTAFGGFYTRIAPPEDSLRFWPGYASVLAGIAFILIANIRVKLLSVIFWISIVPAVICPVSYYVEYQNLTAAYGESRVICGTVNTTKGADYAAKNPAITREELIRDFGGQIGDIWTEASIKRARLTLGLSYSAAVAFLAFVALTGLQKAKPQ